MKILYVIESLNAGGKERRFIELIRVMCNLNEIEIILLSKSTHYTEIFEFDVKLHYLKRNFFKDIKIFYKFFKIIKNFEPDIVHCWDNIGAIHFGPMCKILKIPFINSMITTAPQKLKFFSKRNLSTIISYPFSDAIVSNSKAGANSFKSPKNKTFIIHNGFDLSRLEKVKDSNSIKKLYNLNNYKVIGMVANFTEMKDYKTFIDAALIIYMKRKDVKFIAVGSGPNLNKMKAYLPPTLKNNFMFLGNIKDVDSLVNCFTIGVLSTYSEGISNSVMEYMAFKKPVVVTDGGGSSEIVINSTTGYMSKYKDPIDLSEKVLSILNDDDKIKMMGLESYKRINSHFSISKMVSDTEKLYNKFIR